MSIMASMLWPAREELRIQPRMAVVADVDLLMRPIVRASRSQAIPLVHCPDLVLATVMPLRCDFVGACPQATGPSRFNHALRSIACRQAPTGVACVFRGPSTAAG